MYQVASLGHTLPWGQGTLGSLLPLPIPFPDFTAFQIRLVDSLGKGSFPPKTPLQVPLLSLAHLLGWGDVMYFVCIPLLIVNTGLKLGRHYL